MMHQVSRRNTICDNRGIEMRVDQLKAFLNTLPHLFLIIRIMVL